MKNNIKPFFKDRFTNIFDDFFFNDFFPAQLTNNINYDIQKVKDDLYRISINVAGIKKENIDITIENNFLNVKGKNSIVNNDEKDYLYKGIAIQFSSSFNIPDGAKIEGATLENGILHIDIKTINNYNNRIVKIPIK